MSALLFMVCADCATAHWPPRLLCPTCAGRVFTAEPARHGVVEARTARRHRPREARRDPVGGWQERRIVPIASVRTDLGPVIVAWSPDDVAPGGAVELSRRGGAALARRPGAAGETAGA